jgi:hypothetical protein
MGKSRGRGRRPSPSLTDSPVGLLAWILERYWDWSDHREDLWARLERDYVLRGSCCTR